MNYNEAQILEIKMKIKKLEPAYIFMYPENTNLIQSQNY